MVAERPVVWSITWLLVRTSPDLLMMMPVPAAAALLYCKLLLMTTMPGSTAFSTFCTVAGLMLAGEALLPVPPPGRPKLPPLFPEPEPDDAPGGVLLPASTNETTRPPAVAASAATAM